MFIFVLNQVEPNARRIEEHRRKYDRLRKEREERRRQRRQAETQVSNQGLLCCQIFLFYSIQLM